MKCEVHVYTYNLRNINSQFKAIKNDLAHASSAVPDSSNTWFANSSFLAADTSSPFTAFISQMRRSRRNKPPQQAMTNPLSYRSNASLIPG